MYEALRELTVSDPSGGFRRVQAGEEVPGFHLWPVVNQQAAINTHMVRERPVGAGPAAAGHWPTITEQREAFERAQPEVRAAFTPVTARASLAPEPEDNPPDVLVQAPDAAPPGVSLLSEQVDEPDAALEADNHVCGDCDFRAASAQGLRLHITRKHGV